MQGMYISPVESVIEGIIRNKLAQPFNENTYRDIQDELSVILGDNLMRLYIANGCLFIDYKDHNRNRKGYRVELIDFAQK